MLFQNKNTQRKAIAILGLPFIFLLTQCAKDFDPPTKTGAAKVSEEVVTAGLSEPVDVVIVPESAAGGSLNHEDLLVANSEDSTIVRINKSAEPHTVVPFADQSKTTDLNQPTGIAFDDKGEGDVYVSNFLDETGTTVSAGAVVVFNKDGSLDRVINNAFFGQASDIVYDEEHSTATRAVFFISNRADSTIAKLVSDGTGDVVTKYADLGFLHLGGANPTQLAISPIEPHKLYAANTGFRTSGDPVGSTIAILPTDATAAVPSNDIRLILAGEVTGPLSLGFDDEGNLFVGGHKKGTLVMIDPEIGFKIKSVETGEGEIQGMAVGEGGIYIASEAGKIIEVNKSLLTGESSGGLDGGCGHHCE